MSQLDVGDGFSSACTSERLAGASSRASGLSLAGCWKKSGGPTSRRRASRSSTSCYGSITTTTVSCSEASTVGAGAGPLGLKRCGCARTCDGGVSGVGYWLGPRRRLADMVASSSHLTLTRFKRQRSMSATVSRSSASFRTIRRDIRSCSCASAFGVKRTSRDCPFVADREPSHVLPLRPAGDPNQKSGASRTGPPRWLPLRESSHARLGTRGAVK
jgi:hypothetical protein